MANILENVPGPVGDIIGGKKAKKSSKNQLAEIRKLFEGLNLYGDQMFGKAMGEIDKVGGASRKAIDSQTRQHMASSQQQLASSGLWGSTVGPSMERGIRSDAMRQQGQLEEQLAQMRAGLYTGQAGFRQGNTFNLASILGGVQHKAPNTTAGMAQMFAQIFAGGGMG